MLGFFSVAGMKNARRFQRSRTLHSLGSRVRTQAFLLHRSMRRESQAPSRRRHCGDEACGQQHQTSGFNEYMTLASRVARWGDSMSSPLKQACLEKMLGHWISEKQMRKFLTGVLPWTVREQSRSADACVETSFNLAMPRLAAIDGVF